jgi:hypothetical protein
MPVIDGTRKKPKRRIRRNKPRPCYCSGYWFPHRKGGGCCHSNPMAAFLAAERQGIHGEELERIRFECLVDAPGIVYDEPPF